MKKILLLILVSLTVNSLVAQNNLSIKEKAIEKTDKLHNDIGLNVDQLEDIQLIFEELETTNESINNNISLSSDQKNELLKKNNSTEIKKLESILTQDQFTRYKFIKSTQNSIGGVKKMNTQTKSRN